MGIEISYNNSTIASLSGEGTEVLETSGKFLTDDLTIAYDSSGVAVTASISDPNGTIGAINYIDASGVFRGVTPQPDPETGSVIWKDSLPVDSLVVVNPLLTPPQYSVQHLTQVSYTIFGSNACNYFYKVIE